MVSVTGQGPSQKTSSSGDENEFNSVVAQRMPRGRGWGSRHKFTNDNFAFHESTNK